MITLKTLSTATAQEVFDQVANHLLTQNKKSVSKFGSTLCAYRGYDGTKCAAGCLMADDEYKESFEGRIWWSLERDGISQNQKSLITNLQQIHDDYEPEVWRQRLIGVAQRYSLTFNF